MSLISVIARSSLRHPSVFLFLCGLLGAAGCGSDDGPSTCRLESTLLPGDALTEVADARLDLVADRFVLLGASRTEVQWARLDASGVLGARHAVPIPAHRAGPWFAVAGSAAAPSDRLVVAYLVDSERTDSVTLPLVTVSVGLDDGVPSEPVQIGRLPDPDRVPLQVAMASGRSGVEAGLAWGVRGGSAAIGLAVLGGDGLPVDAPVTPAADGLGFVVTTVADDFDCLGFAPGYGDLTVSVLDQSGTPPAPALLVNEVDASGGLSSSLRMILEKRPTGCVEVAPTAAGHYALAWHHVEGTYTGSFSPVQAADAFQSDLVVADVRFADGPPTVLGLGDTGRDIALVVRRAARLESWRVDATSRRRGGALDLSEGELDPGLASSQPLGQALFVTHVGSFAAGSGSAGGERVTKRVFQKITCP